MLPRLVSSGLIEQRGGLRVGVDALREGARDRSARVRALPGATPEQARVLRNFVEDGRLKALPVKSSLRRVVLEYAADLFEHGVEYSEREVNETLVALYRDFASLRRYLVDEGLLARERGGVYHRT